MESHNLRIRKGIINMFQVQLFHHK